MMNQNIVIEDTDRQIHLWHDKRWPIGHRRWVWWATSTSDPGGQSDINKGGWCRTRWGALRQARRAQPPTPLRQARRFYNGEGIES